MTSLITLGIAFVFLLLMLALDRMALKLMRPAHRPPGREPSDLGLAGREWDISGDPPLKGWWMEGEDPAGPVVLLAHGWGANGGVVLPLARAVAPVASAMVTYDVRGHGRSDRASLVSIRQFRDDAMRAVNAVTAERPGTAVILAGHSLGGAAGILAAAQGAPLAGLILVATPFDVYGAIGRYLRERRIPGHLLVPLLKPFWRVRVGLPERVLHPGRNLERVKLPTLIIQPENDLRVPLSDGERLARASGGRLAVVPGAGHADVLQHPLTGELMRAFMTGVETRAGTSRSVP